MFRKSKLFIKRFMYFIINILFLFITWFWLNYSFSKLQIYEKLALIFRANPKLIKKINIEKKIKR